MDMFWVEIADGNQTERQIQFLKTHLKRGIRVLDVACGSGRHVIPLIQDGFNAVGLDVSLRLLKIAKQRGASALVRGDMRYLPFKSATFGASVSMDTSFGYLPSEKDDLKSLEEIKRVLNRNGELLIDVFNRENLIAKYLDKTLLPKKREYPSFHLEQKRKVSAEGDWLCDDWIITEKQSGKKHFFKHAVRLYKSTQLEGLLSIADFTIKSVFGDYGSQPFSQKAHRHIILACSSI